MTSNQRTRCPWCSNEVIVSYIDGKMRWHYSYANGKQHCRGSGKRPDEFKG